MSKVLYIDGDSWLQVPRMYKFLQLHYGMFEDCLIINHAVPGDNNHDIIQRTIKNVDAIKSISRTPIYREDMRRDLENRWTQSYWSLFFFHRLL